MVVGDESEGVPEAYPDPGQGGPAGPGTPEGPGKPGGTGETSVPPIALRVLDAPELDPQNVTDQGTVAWTDPTNVESEPPTGPPL